MKKNKTRKIIAIIAGVLLIVVVLVIAFISPISKYLVEKYSVKYLGRQIKMSWMYVNPFTGSVYISHIKMYEHQNDTVFFSADGISARFAILKMLHKTYEISYLKLSKPWVRIVQNRRQMNLDDLIQKFSPDSTAPPKPDKGPVHFNLLDLAISDGEFHYEERTIPVNYFIKEVNFKSPGLRWDRDTIEGNVSLKSGPAKGSIKADFTINLKNFDYRATAVVQQFELDIIDQYLHDIANYGSFSANLDADVKAKGNLKDQLDVIASGKIGVNDFHFGKKPGDDFASFDTLLVALNEVNPKHFRYILDSMVLRKPFFKYEKYDNLDNIQTMFGKGGANYKAVKADSAKFNLIVQIADYVNTLAKNFLQSYYKIDRVAIYNADIKFDDYSIREKFGVAASPLNITANAIDRNHKRVMLSVRSGIKPYGNLGLDLSIDPKDYNQFDLNYDLQKISVPSFNPYIITYTSFPLDRGTLQLTGKWNVRDGQIQSDNHLIVLDPRTGKRLHKKDTKWIPVPLIMSLVRTPGSAIDFDIPIAGNLKDPKFKVWGAIGEVVKNIFVKPPSVAYLVHVKDEEKTVEKLLTVKWPMRSAKLNPAENKFLTKVADFLNNHAQTSISVEPLEYTEKEKEYILFFEAKKKYCLLSHKHSDQGQVKEEDSLEIDKMSVKDSAFVRFLNARYKDSLMFTIQEKCLAFVGFGVVNLAYAHLLKERKDVVEGYFRNIGEPHRVKIAQSKAFVPFDGFSYFKIDYHGDLPDDLVKAYNTMNELDEKNPRGKYKDERRKNGGVLLENREAREMGK